jgi:hypothetical protein
MRVLRTSSSEAADSGTRDMASYYDHLVVADRTMPIKAIDDGPYRGTGGLVVNTEMARKMPIWPDDSDGPSDLVLCKTFQYCSIVPQGKRPNTCFNDAPIPSSLSAAFWCT